MKKIPGAFVALMLVFESVAAQSPEKIMIDADIQLVALQDSFFRHVSWTETRSYGRISSNGVILVRAGRALMLDTPMEEDKTAKLINYLQDSMNVKVQRLIVGHFHDDCLGGLRLAHNLGIESIANSMTIRKCRELNLPIPMQAFTDSISFDFYGERVECSFPGGGHTFDNIVVWFPARKILFGGCLIKSAHSRGLGNTADADMDAWASTVARLMNRYKTAVTVVPGHGKPGSTELLTHTLELVHKLKPR